MLNTDNVIFIILIFIIFTKCDDFCKGDKWWELGNFDYNPVDFCENVDEDYEINKDFLYKICTSNITEYREIVKNELSSVGNYSFVLQYFTDLKENTKLLSCYNKTKHYILMTGVENKLNQILPRKNNHIFEGFKFLNSFLDIPFVIWKGMKSVLISSIAYLTFK